MKLVNKKITLEELGKIAQNRFGEMVKAVVDIEEEIMIVDAELHSDQEAYLLEKGSKQESLWGINLYPDRKDNDFIEFNSLINIRPSVGNLSMSVEDEGIQEKIREIVDKLISK